MSDAARLLSYLEHILQAIERIQRYTVEFDEAAFVQNEMAQDAEEGARLTRTANNAAVYTADTARELLDTSRAGTTIGMWTLEHRCDRRANSVSPFSCRRHPTTLVETWNLWGQRM